MFDWILNTSLQFIFLFPIYISYYTITTAKFYKNYAITEQKFLDRKYKKKKSKLKNQRNKKKKTELVNKNWNIQYVTTKFHEFHKPIVVFKHKMIRDHTIKRKISVLEKFTKTKQKMLYCLQC